MIEEEGQNELPFFCIYLYQKLLEQNVKRKIELFMVLFLLIGAIVASWKLSELTTSVVKDVAIKATREEPVYP